MNDFRKTSLLFLFVFSMWKCRASDNETDCGYEKCQLGYQFCEPEKLICRHCSDFQKTCFQDVLHIANCSSFCKAQLPNAQNDCNRDLWIYLLTAVSILVIFFALGLVIYRMRRKYCSVRKKLSNVEDWSRTAHEEDAKFMIDIDNDETQGNLKKKFVDAGKCAAKSISIKEAHDQNDGGLEKNCQPFNQINPTNYRLQGTRDLNSDIRKCCQQLNQINPTNDSPECKAMAINGKILPPRVNDSAGVH